MAQAMPKVGLRPYLPADTSVLASIFVASVEQLTGDDYSEAQREAWASMAEDEDHSASVWRDSSRSLPRCKARPSASHR